MNSFLWYLSTTVRSMLGTVSTWLFQTYYSESSPGNLHSLLELHNFICIVILPNGKDRYRSFQLMLSDILPPWHWDHQVVLFPRLQGSLSEILLEFFVRRCVQ